MKKFLSIVGLIGLVLLLSPLNAQAKTSYRTSNVCKSNGDDTCDIVYTMKLTENSKSLSSVKYTFEFAPAEGKQNGIVEITFNTPDNIKVDVEETEKGYVVTYTATEGNLTGETVDLGSYTVTRKTGSEYSSVVKFIVGGETKTINYAGKSSSAGVKNPSTGAELPIVVLGTGSIMALAIVLTSKQKKKLYKI